MKEINKFDFFQDYNILVVGDKDVGKTNLISRFVEGKFSSIHRCNIGTEFKDYNYINNLQTFKIRFFDMSKRDPIRSIHKAFLMRAQGLIFVYSTENRDTFDSIKIWYNSFKSKERKEPIALLLLGNKCDSPEKVITYEEGEILGNELGMEFFEVSTKTGERVMEVLETFIEKIVDLLTPQKHNLKIFLNMKKKKKYKNKTCQT